MVNFSNVTIILYTIIAYSLRDELVKYHSFVVILIVDTHNLKLKGSGKNITFMRCKKHFILPKSVKFMKVLKYCQISYLV